MHDIIRLTIAPGAEWGFLATVETLVGKERATAERSVRHILPTKEDCHSLATHLARQRGLQKYEVQDQTIGH